MEEKTNKIYGPSLPPGKELESKEKNIEPQIKSTSSCEYFGPILPPHLLQNKNKKNEDNFEHEKDFTNNSDNNEELIVGPLPSTSSSKNDQHRNQLEVRALELKIKNIRDDNPNSVKDEISRETWMTELPDLEKSGLGMFARQFRKKNAPDMKDRSVWTDIPNKPKPAPDEIESKKETKYFSACDKNKKHDEEIKKYKKKHKRDKSLMEIHAKKLKKEKKKKKKNKEKEERRPFNRETDLQVNRFDEARKKSVIKKAQLLDSRFHSGHSKYL